MVLGGKNVELVAIIRHISPENGRMSLETVMQATELLQKGRSVWEEFEILGYCWFIFSTF